MAARSRATEVKPWRDDVDKSARVTFSHGTLHQQAECLAILRQHCQSCGLRVARRPDPYGFASIAIVPCSARSTKIARATSDRPLPTSPRRIEPPPPHGTVSDTSYSAPSSTRNTLSATWASMRVGVRWERQFKRSPQHRPDECSALACCRRGWRMCSFQHQNARSPSTSSESATRKRWSFPFGSSQRLHRRGGRPRWSSTRLVAYRSLIMRIRAIARRSTFCRSASRRAPTGASTGR